jgi:hypothetical protein
MSLVDDEKQKIALMYYELESLLGGYSLGYVKTHPGDRNKKSLTLANGDKYTIYHPEEFAKFVHQYLKNYNCVA